MRVRVASSADGAGLAAIYGPVVAQTAVSFEAEPPSPAEMARRVAEILPEYPWLVVDDDGFIAGYAYAHRFAARVAYSWSVETSVYVHRDRTRSGVGSALYRALIPILRRQGYRQVVAGATQPNPASDGLHAAFGFRPVALYRSIGWKLGAWQDVQMRQLDLGGSGPPPTDPVPFAALPHDFIDQTLAAAVVLP